MATGRIDATALRAALDPVLDWLDADPRTDDTHTAGPPRAVVAAAVRVSLRALAQHAPGKAVEVRVPPFAAVQCLPGGSHTRGTPPHVVQTDPRRWLELVTGRLSWSAAVKAGVVQASGHRANEVGDLLPLTNSDQKYP